MHGGKNHRLWYQRIEKLILILSLGISFASFRIRWMFRWETSNSLRPYQEQEYQSFLANFLSWSFDIITYDFYRRACDITPWASILLQQLFLMLLLKNEHSSLLVYRFGKHVIKLNFRWESQKFGHFLSSSTHDREIFDQSFPSSSNARRITFFSDFGWIWFQSVRRTFYRQLQKSTYLVTISSHGWDILKSNFSALYLKDNQNGPSQATIQTKISHFIFKEQKKFPIHFKSFKSLGL